MFVTAIQRRIHHRDWWLAGGLDSAKAIVAFDPKSAVTYADSKVNLANPGTYDAAIVSGKTTDPTFASGTGWTFASGKALSVPLGLYSLGGEQVVLFRVSGITNTTNNFITGLFHTTTTRNYWSVARAGATFARYGSTNTASGSGISSGIVGMRRTDSNTNTECWLNGVVVDTTSSTYDLTGGVNAFLIGCHYTLSSNAFAGWFTGTLEAAFVGKNMTDAEVLNISNAMAAL